MELTEYLDGFSQELDKRDFHNTQVLLTDVCSCVAQEVHKCECEA